jgi:hypothetical protein
MAKAGYAKKISSSVLRKHELTLSFPIGATFTTIKGKDIIIASYWGDRCIVADDNNIYNVEYDLGYKFNYQQIK